VLVLVRQRVVMAARKAEKVHIRIPLKHKLPSLAPPTHKLPKDPLSHQCLSVTQPVPTRSPGDVLQRLT
jgi:hypothetical protein